MEQYGAMAQGQIWHRHTIGEIAGYAAAIGAGLAMVGTADAAIVYSGVNQNLLAPTVPGTGNNFFSNTAVMTAIDGNKVRGYARDSTQTRGKYVNEFDAIRGSNIGFIASGGKWAKRLFKNTSITANAGFGGTVAGFDKFQSYTPGGSINIYTNSHFAPGTTGFVGIKLPSGDLGWILLQMDTNGSGFPDGVKVISWAYNDISGQSILAGQSTGPTQTVPDPSSLALLAAGALGLAAFRRRKAASAK